MTRSAAPASLLALSLTAFGCGPGRVRAPPPPPATPDRPSDAIPSDLDLVVRVDFRRVKSALGPEVLAALEKSAPASDDAMGDDLMSALFARADTVWIGLRPAESFELSDSVLVVRGEYGSFDPRRFRSEPRWAAPADLGGGWLRYDRKQPPKQRSAPARIYLKPPELGVVATVAELDGIERSLELGARDPHPDPPEKGLLSLEARAAPLAATVSRTSPSAADLLGTAKKLRAIVDLDAAGFGLELDVEFSDPEKAQRAADAVGLLARAMSEKQSVEGKIARATHVEAVDRTLVAKVSLPQDELTQVIACTQFRTACADSETRKP